MTKTLSFFALICVILLAVNVQTPLEAKGKKRSNAALEKMVKSTAHRLDAKVEFIKAVEFKDDRDVRGMGAIWEKYLPSQKKPDRVMDRVCAALLEKIASVEDEAIAKELVEDVADVKTPVKLRDAYFQIVILLDSKEVSDLCVKLAEDPSALMRVLSVDELGQRAYKEGFSVVMNALKDADRRVQVAALDSLELYGKYHDNFKEAILKELCVRYMQHPRNRGERLSRCRKVLQALTKHDAGSDPRAWLEWWREQKKENKAEKVEGRKDNGGTSVKRIWDIDTSSNQLVFVIDTSSSMAEKIPVDPNRRKPISGGDENDEEKKRNKGIDWSKVKNKLDLARADLKQYLNMMKPNEYFTIVSYSSKVDIWKEEIVPATEKNIDAAHAYLNKLKTGKLTNIYGALSRAIKVAEDATAEADSAKKKKKKKKKSKSKRSSTRGDEDPDFHPVPDTIIFMTDGYATTGDYCLKGVEGKATTEQTKKYTKTMNEMLKEIKTRNRAVRVTIHAVAVGNKGEFDKATLKKLAQQNKGDYRELKTGTAAGSKKK